MLDSRGSIAKLRLRKERNAKSGAAGNRRIARTRSRMARVLGSQKGQARLQRESRPFSRHREECIVARRLAWFYRGRDVGIFGSCLVRGRSRGCASGRLTGDGFDSRRDPLGTQVSSLLTITCCLIIRNTSAFFELHTIS